MRSLFARPIPQHTDIIIDGRPVRVTVKVHARARHYRLSLPNARDPVLTLPPNGRWKEAEAFLARQQAWLAARLGAKSDRPALEPGSSVMLRGVRHTIAASGRVRGQVERGEDGEGPVLVVPGAPEHLARRLVDWMKKEAQIDLERQTAIHARTLGVRVKSVTLRSQATRWGSCSSAGSLNYNWRLVAAPPFVLDYVAAHEVAHLVEMNHSAAFWRTVELALPDYELGKAWLRTHGRELMTLGA